MTPARIVELAGLSTAIAGTADSRTAVVLLHGHGMRPLDLVPFASSLAVPALFLFPQGPVPAGPAGHAWWPVDIAKKTTALRAGPRDLFDQQPAGLAAARESIRTFLEAVRAKFNPRHIVLGGFSQGGMLACDWALRSTIPIDALVLMSASRIDFQHWGTCRERALHLPVLVSHGKHDADLDFSAGERLREFLSSRGASVTWVPFEGEHEIPLLVWRRLRRFLTDLIQREERRDLPTASPLG